MRRRTRELITVVVGLVLLIAGALFANYFLIKGKLAEEMDAWRTMVEEERIEQGYNVLDWDLPRKTKGSLRSGPTFDPEMEALDGEFINVIGFMVPLNQFRNVTEFLLLPLPIECYFCERPPARDVMFVQLEEGETSNIFKEPVLLTGRLALNPGEKVKYFYRLEETVLGAGKTGGDLTRRSFDPQHMAPSHTTDETTLVEGVEPPAGGPAE